MRQARVQGRSGVSERGMTFLEVVFGAALVVMIGATVTGLFTYITSTQRREQRMLACAEVANRLMLNYLDNPAAMPDPNKVVEYGPPESPAKFRWEIKEERIELEEARPEGRDTAREGPLRRDRMKQVTIRAWLSELSGGSQRPDGSTPQVTLARMIDPLALRNPDSTENMLKDPAAYQKWFEAMMGFTQGQTVMQPQGTAGGGAPRTAAASSGTNSRLNAKVDPRRAFGRGRSSRETSGSWAYEQWGGPGRRGSD
jgi:type II secretory pathway pseudopilin PulG